MNEILIEQCSYLIDDTLPNIANISNLIALLYHEMENINWLGFYICDETNNECSSEELETTYKDMGIDDVMKLG